MTFFITNAAAIAAANAVVDLVDTGGAGSLIIYDGTPPADADTALSGNTTLVTMTLNNPAFGAAADGAPGADAALDVTGGISGTIAASGTASFFRMLDNGATVRIQGTVGTSGADINFDSVAFSSGATASVTSYTYTQPES